MKLIKTENDKLLDTASEEFINKVEQHFEMKKVVYIKPVDYFMNKILCCKRNRIRDKIFKESVELLEKSTDIASIINMCQDISTIKDLLFNEYQKELTRIPSINLDDNYSLKIFKNQEKKDLHLEECPENRKRMMRMLITSDMNNRINRRLLSNFIKSSV